MRRCPSSPAGIRVLSGGVDGSRLIVDASAELSSPNCRARQSVLYPAMRTRPMENGVRFSVRCLPAQRLNGSIFRETAWRSKLPSWRNRSGYRIRYRRSAGLLSNHVVARLSLDSRRSKVLLIIRVVRRSGFGILAGSRAQAQNIFNAREVEAVGAGHKRRQKIAPSTKAIAQFHS
jgi:hypothetical protein